jgi:hypothetical protein
MNNQTAISYLDAVSQDIELLKNGESFDKHQFNSMIELLNDVLDFLTVSKEEQAQ